MYLLTDKKIFDNTTFDKKDNITLSIAQKLYNDNKVISFNSIIEDIYHIIDGKTGIVIPYIELKNPLMYGNTEIKVIPIINFTRVDDNIKINEPIQIDFIKENDSSIDDVYLYYIGDKDTTNNKNNKLWLTNCPSCGDELIHDEEQMYCINPHCPAQIKYKCDLFNNVLGIKLHGIYTDILNTLIVRNIIKTPIDIFTLICNNHIPLNKLLVGEQYTNDRLKVFANLVTDVIGKINMYQVLKGLGLRIPDDSILEYVKHNVEYYKNKEQKIFGIKEFLNEITNFKIEVSKIFNKDLLTNKNRWDFHLFKTIDEKHMVLPGLNNTNETIITLTFVDKYRDLLDYLDKMKIIGSVYASNNN